MKITVFQRLQNSLKAFSLRFSLSDFDLILDRAIGGQPSATGIDVSNDSALSFSAVFNAVAIIAGTIASLPLILYRRVGEHGKMRMVEHPLHDLLHNQPNPEMTSYVWREISQAHLLLWGNAYSWIERDVTGRVVGLWPQNPERTKVKRENGVLVYYVDEGPGKERMIAAENMLHIPGLGYDGRIGYSVLSLAREAMGLGLGMEKFQARFYGAGTNIGSVLEHPGRLGKEALDHLKESLAQKYAGLEQSHKTLILEEGMKWQKMGMPLEDAQFLESRVYQIAEIARWFNLPPHKLKELTRATFSNIEQQQIEFVQDCIRPWAVRWEQHIAWKCLRQEERQNIFAEFLIDALLRGDTVSRNQALSLQRQNGIITANEWRAIENMNPQEGKAGDMIWMPLNYMDANAESAGQDTNVGGGKTKEKPEEKPEEEPKEEEKSHAVNPELRALRSMRRRRRMAEAFKPVFRNAAQDILTRERAKIAEIIHETLGKRDAGSFIAKSGQFYESFKGYVRQRFAQVYAEYGEMVFPLAAEEVNASEELTAEFREYLEEFASHTAERYINSSRGQLKAIAHKHRENNTEAALFARLDEWDETRADKIAEQETIAGETGIARFVYAMAGMAAVWVSSGSSCPYCSSLDGKGVGRGDNFVKQGESFQPEGAEEPIVPEANIGHPPAHSGCDCSVRAGR